MKEYVKKLVCDANGWPAVLSTTEPKVMEEDHTALLKSAKYSDLTIRCAGKEWRLHRAIVCPKAKFFERAIGGEFEEAATGIINLHEDDPAIFSHVIDYLYTLRYSNYDSDARDSILARFPSLTAQPLTSREQLEEHCESQVFADEIKDFKEDPSYPWYIFNMMCRKMEMDVQVYFMADKYDIPGLKELAHARFAEEIRACQGPLWAKFNDNTIQSIVLSVIQSTPSTNKDIRETVAHVCARNIDTITGIKLGGRVPADKAESQAWAKVFTEDADFTWDILKRVTQQKAHEKAATEDKWLEYASRNLTLNDRAKQAEIEAAKNELMRYKERTGRLLKAIGGQQCHVCGSMFQLELLTAPQDPHDYTVRCCACEHKFTGASTT